MGEEGGMLKWTHESLLASLFLQFTTWFLWRAMLGGGTCVRVVWLKGMNQGYCGTENCQVPDQVRTPWV